MATLTGPFAVGTHEYSWIDATGHGMLGYTMGPITGKCVADMITKAKPLSFGHALQITRF
jgi:glycine/D-amino acid oxidase-like deaminating enzyme